MFIDFLTKKKTISEASESPSNVDELKARLEEIRKEIAENQSERKKLQPIIYNYKYHRSEMHPSLDPETAKEYQNKFSTLIKDYPNLLAEEEKLKQDIRFYGSGKTNELADDEDWDDILADLPEEIEYEDLEAEVHQDADDEPVGWNYKTDSIIYREYPAMDGYINHYIYSVEPTQELVCEFLGKKKEDVTRKDLAYLDSDAYYEFIQEKFIDDAREACEDDWENGKIDVDQVDWEEPPEPDPDDYPEYDD